MLNTLLKTHKIKVTSRREGRDHLYLHGLLNDVPISVSAALTNAFIVVDEKSTTTPKEYKVNDDYSSYKLVCRIMNPDTKYGHRFEHPVLHKSLENSRSTLENYAAECLELCLKNHYALYSTKHPA